MEVGRVVGMGEVKGRGGGHPKKQEQQRIIREPLRPRNSEVKLVNGRYNCSQVNAFVVCVVHTRVLGSVLRGWGYAGWWSQHRWDGWSSRSSPSCARH